MILNLASISLFVLVGCAHPSSQPVKTKSSEKVEKISKGKKEKPRIQHQVPTFSSGYAPINGLQMYYEVHGRDEGTPLVLLHGGGSTIDVTYSKILPFFAKDRKVIALEEQAHGRTSDRDKPVRFETSADDVAELLNYLHVKKADILGFSNGGNVAMEVAIRHPEKVRKLIVASAAAKKEGYANELWTMLAKADFSDMPQPLKDAFLKVNPNPEKLKNMHDKDMDRMRNFKDLTTSELKSIRAPTLVLLGDRDIVRPEYAVEMSRMIPNARLTILPGGHGEYLGEALTSPQDTDFPEITAALVEEFLKMPSK